MVTKNPNMTYVARSFTSSVHERFPIGTRVGVYEDPGVGLHGQAPSAEPIETAKVSARGLAFEDLPVAVPLVLYAEIGGEHRFLAFRTGLSHERSLTQLERNAAARGVSPDARKIEAAKRTR